jgi:hypothetical protein
LEVSLVRNWSNLRIPVDLTADSTVGTADNT